MRDLAAPHEPQEVRHAVLKFLSALIRGQYQTLGPLRGYFFEVLRSHQVPEDLMERCVGTCVCLLVIMTGVHGEVHWDVCVFYW